MNSELHIPTFVNPVDCAFYGKEFPYNQHMEELHFIHNGGNNSFSEQRNPLRFNLNTERYTSGEVNNSICDVNEMNFAQQKHAQEHNLVHDEILPFGSASCDSSLSRKGKRTRERSFICEVCGRAFFEMSSLTVHSRIHSGERPFPCEVCDKTFASKEGLRSHLVVHSEEKRFPCDLCDKKFARKQEMQHHRLVHTGEKPHVCDLCQKAFSVKQKLKDHMRRHSEERPHACDHCGKRFKLRVDLREHVRFHAKEKPFLCESCPKRFFIKTHLKLHQRVHTGERRYHCQVCPKQYANRESFLKHVQNHDEQSDSQTIDANSETKREVFICDTCREEFAEQCELEKHLLYHKREKPFACFICGVRFFRSPTLKVHLSVMHAESERFTCEICDKSWSSKNLLQKHSVTHSRQFACDLCDKAFQSKLYLVAHARVHNKIVHRPRQYACRFCQRNFRSKQRFLSHSRSHNKMKDLGHGDHGPCDQCGKRFTRRRYLLRHVLSHSRTKKPRQCTVCSKRFIDGYHLRRHARIHTGEKPYTCPVCQVQYSDKQCFLKHVCSHGGELRDLQAVKMSSVQITSTEKGDISCDAEGNESYRNQCLEKYIPGQSNVKAFKEQRQLKEEVMSTELSTPAETILPEGAEGDTASHLLSALAELADRFVNDSKGNKIPRKSSLVDSEVRAVVSELVETTVERSADNPLACNGAEGRGFPRNIEHSRVDSVAKPFGCAGCEKRFAKEEELNRHRCVPTSRGPFVCRSCKKQFSERRELERHFLAHKHAIACEFCGLVFLHLNDLTTHLRIHSGQKPFPCYKCEEKFDSAEELRIHFVVHAKPFACDLCEKRFSSKFTLENHGLCHTEERPHACDHCDKRFKRKKELKAHNSYHAAEKPFRCDSCPKRFYVKTHLRLHQRVHTGEKLYHCPVCPVQYSNRESFKWHCRKHEIYDAANQTCWNSSKPKTKK